MATVSQTFRALIEADAKGAVKDLQKFNGEVEKATVGGAKKTDQLNAAFKKVGGVVAGLGIAKVMTDSISAASDLEESVNAVRVTFGDAADSVLELSENSARGVGLAASDFNSLAVQFAAFADEVAGPGGDVAGVIDDLTKRSADFASVMNLDVADAARIFSSTLAGESEPIKRFGIIIDDTTVKAKALEMGLADTAAEVSANDKVLARFELLMEETEKTAGDFANTSDSLANQTKIAKAELKDAAATIGQELLPVAADAAGVLGDVAGVLGNMPSAARQFTVAAGAVIAGMSTIGTKATATLGLLGLVAGEVQALSAGIQGDMDFLSRDVSIFEKPFQLAGRFGYALGSGDGWGSWRDEALDALDTAEAAAARFDATLLEGVDTTEGAKTAIFEWADGLGLSDEAARHAAATVAAQYLPAIREAATEAMISAEMQRDQAKAAEHTATVMKNVADRQREAAEATERHREAVAALFDEVNDNLSSMFDYEEATIGVEDAVKDFVDAQVEAIEVNNDAESSASDYEQAMRDVRTAEIDAANAALDASAKYAESQGAIEGTTEFAMLQREELGRLAEKFPELSDEIGQFIDELNRIPAVKTVSLVINRAGTNAALASSGTGVRVNEFGDLIPGRAAGGPVSAGRTYLVGERGPELLTMGSSSGYVIPNKAIGGAGGNVYNINVTAPAGADADAFGRAVREAIRRETRWSGPVTGWSAA